MKHPYSSKIIVTKFIAVIEGGAGDTVKELLCKPQERATINLVSKYHRC
jgi:hypothetical protein